MKKLKTCCRLLVLAVAGAALTGCALMAYIPGVASRPDASGFNDLVPRDFVSVLTQIEELAPSSTIFGTSNEGWQPGKFASALQEELAAAGYAIRSVGSGPGTLSIGYTVVEEQAQNNSGQPVRAQTVTLMAEDIALRRSYTVDAQGLVRPLGTMQVRGTDANKLTLYSDIFTMPEQSRNRNARPMRPAPTPDTGEQLVQNPAAATVMPERRADVEVAEPDVDPAMSVVSAAAPVAQRNGFLDLADASAVVINQRSRETLRGERANQTQNVLALRRSNFEHLLVGTGLVDEKILTFAEDSVRLTQVSDTRIQSLVSKFNADTDLFSVVGCSLGKVEHPDGPEDLARTRSEAVREALLREGIPDKNILAEACWSDETFDMRMPRHGVVVALARRIT